MSNMSVSDISRLMNLYTMNTVTNSGINSENSSSGSSSLGSSNSILFEYMLKAAMGSGTGASTCSHCGYNNENSGNTNILNSITSAMTNSGLNSNLGSTLNSTSNVASNLSSTGTSTSKSASANKVYGVYGDFHPMGKAPTLSSKDINISPRINDAIKAASKKHGVEESFIKGIIKQESSFNPNSTSSAGAQGLMQLMSYNSKEYGVKNPYNIEDNVNGGVKYIKDLLDKFDGNKQLALSAYNGGITRMSKRGVDTVPEIVNMPKETRDYVSKVMGYYNQYKEVQNI